MCFCSHESRRAESHGRGGAAGEFGPSLGQARERLGDAHAALLAGGVVGDGRDGALVLARGACGLAQGGAQVGQVLVGLRDRLNHQLLAGVLAQAEQGAALREGLVELAVDLR